MHCFYVCRKIKVWDLTAALDPRSPTGTLCLRTLVEHTGRVFRLQFDDFQIVSSSHDDTILIWDFLNPETTQSINVIDNHGTTLSTTLSTIDKF